MVSLSIYPSSSMFIWGDLSLTFLTSKFNYNKELDTRYERRQDPFGAEPLAISNLCVYFEGAAANASADTDMTTEVSPGHS